jgi:REP element-mobilizing transposase RayT
MANTYTQINIHAVFSVKGRENIITNHFRNRLHEYISGIINNSNNYSLAVNGYKDHVHVLFELNPALALSDVIRDIKANSSRWINDNKFVLGHFNWQEGYGAFSYSRSQRDEVINYIMTQEEHHRHRSFKEEYLGLLKMFDIPYKDHYVFEFYD